MANAKPVLAALGIAANVAPKRRGPGVQRPRVVAKPTWRDPIEAAKVWTNPRTPKASERAGVRAMLLRTNHLEPDELLRFPNLEKLRLIVIDDAELGPLLERLAELEKLAWLVLECLEEIPPEIGGLPKLRRLEIKGEGVMSPGPPTLPAELFELGKLEELVVDGCMITAVPPAIGNATKLRHLFLNANKPLARLPRELGELPRLRQLDLQRPNALAPARVFEILAHAPELRWLRFRGESFTKLPAAIGDLQRLEHLTVGSHLTTLPDAIAKLQTLRSLDVEFNDLETLPESIVEMPKLARIGLYSNPRLDAVRVVELAVRCKRLRHLHLPATNVPDRAYTLLQDAGFAQAAHMYGDSWIRA